MIKYFNFCRICTFNFQCILCNIAVSVIDYCIKTFFKENLYKYYNDIFKYFRWNFSVGLHDLKVFMDLNNNCYTTNPSVRLDFKINIPNGILTAVAFDQPHEIVWTHKVLSVYFLYLFYLCK